MSLINIYKCFRHNKMLRMIKPYVHLSDRSYYSKSFTVRLSNPQRGRNYLTIGENCIVEGSFIFETDQGNISIGDRCHIGGSTFISRTSITVGDDVTIAWGCLFYDHDSHPIAWEERKNDTIREYEDVIKTGDLIKNKDWSNVKSLPIIIANKAWIGTGVKILKGVTIGEGAIVAAGSVVTKNVEPWTMVGGNPSRFIRKLESADDSI